MRYTVYILYSAIKDKYYIASIENVDKRIAEHKLRNNLGANDWVLKHVEQFATRGEAMQREKEIKSKKKRSYLEKLIMERPA